MSIHLKVISLSLHALQMAHQQKPGWKRAVELAAMRCESWIKAETDKQKDKVVAFEQAMNEMPDELKQASLFDQSERDADQIIRKLNLRDDSA